MNVFDIVIGAKYCATCFNGDACTVLEILQELDPETALLSVEYKGKLYLASSYQLQEKAAV